jgi:GR25 family glycosyltransferase involved in LPS biosynthesis
VAPYGLTVLPNVHVITINEDSNRCKNICEFLDFERIGYKVFKGFDAVKFGLISIKDYKYSSSESNRKIKQENVGCYLSHHSLWKTLLWSTEFEIHGKDSQFTILEDDCSFRADWKENLMLASQSIPKDWDVLMIGSCCAEDKPKTAFGSNLYECKYPFCTHGYIVRGKCLQFLVDSSEVLDCPIDILLSVDIFPKLKVYTILPRICDQDGMDLPA